MNSLDLSLDLLEDIEAPIDTDDGVAILVLALSVGMLIGIAT